MKRWYEIIYRNYQGKLVKFEMYADSMTTVIDRYNNDAKVVISCRVLNK